MNISLNWIKQFVDLPKNIDPQELGLKLTMATVEVEGVSNLAEALENVVVGKVVSLSDHPNADRLRLVKVDVGDREVKVVCGGVNLKEDMLVVMALPGSKVRWHGEGEPIVLETAKVRGEESEGMICAGEEVGLESMFPPKESGEIVDLTEADVKVGQPLAEALGLNDFIYDIDNKSLTNRPDLWGHYGMAREVAAIYDTKLKDYDLDKFKEGKEIDLKVKVENSEDCPRYLGVALKNVKIGASPAWLKKRLQSIGQKSINNVVDVTNYIMYELGQPLHAFSADKIEDYEIIVRKANKGEKVIALDEVEYELNKEDLVIADKKKAVALAGVMGSLGSGISDDTEIVIIEAANFNPVTVRKTSGRLGLRSEASMRFEKSLDPNLAALAIKKAVNLIQDIMPAVEVVSEVVDVKDFKLNEGPIELTWEFVNKRVGVELEKEKIVKILENLGFKVKKSKEGIKVSIPAWRATKDVSIREDIIEEITRVFGYDNLDPVMPAIKIDYAEQNDFRLLERKVKDVLSLSLGGNEVYNYSFVDRTFLEKIGQPIDHLELQNPWAENVNLMRKSLIPNLLQNITDNSRYFEEINIYEVGKTFIDDGAGVEARPGKKAKLPTQDLFVGGAVTGTDAENSFLKAKGLVEVVFESLGLKVSFEKKDAGKVWCHPNQAVMVVAGDETVGYITNLHPQISKTLELKTALAVWEINLNKVFLLKGEEKKYKPLAKYPSIELDLSIVIQEEKNWSDIKNLVQAIDPKLIKKIELLDIFKGGKIKEGTKSLTFRIVYQSDDKTLEMETVTALQSKVVAQLEKAMQAEVRK
jgi:phenylalanyl-tRNA synthetase beta chain